VRADEKLTTFVELEAARADQTAAHWKSNRRRGDPCGAGLRKRVKKSSMTSALLWLNPTVNAILARSVKRAGRFEATPYGLIVKGKRISCPPHYAPPNNDYDPPHHDYEHGFPLIRSLRASTQRSTSVLFSFVLCLLIVAGSFAVRQSKTILAHRKSE
jgi:hypothetical protein